MDINKLIRDMPHDKRAIFLEIYNDLHSKAIEKALRLTKARTDKKRAEEITRARERLPHVIEEITALQNKVIQWKADHPGDIQPAGLSVGKAALIQEREKLESLIKQGV